MNIPIVLEIGDQHRIDFGSAPVKDLPDLMDWMYHTPLVDGEGDSFIVKEVSIDIGPRNDEAHIAVTYEKIE